jgi:hypothetical protein
MAVAVKKPQDRKPKASDPAEIFTFEHEDKTYELPAASTVAAQIPGQVMRDAVMQGEEGQLRLSFFMLERLEGAEEAIKALYAKPAGEMLHIVEGWTTFKPKSGVSLGE